MTDTTIALIVVAALSFGVIVALSLLAGWLAWVNHTAATHRDNETAEERRELLNALMARTPRDFGLLKQLDRPPGPAKAPAPGVAQFKTEAEYLAWVKGEVEAMGLNPISDEDRMPKLPHGMG